MLRKLLLKNSNSILYFILTKNNHHMLAYDITRKIKIAAGKVKRKLL